MQGHAGVVGQRDASAEDVDALFLQELKERCVQGLADALALLCGVDVNRDLSRPAVGGAFAMGTAVGKADHLLLVLGDEPGMGPGRSSGFVERIRLLRAGAPRS